MGFLPSVFKKYIFLTLAIISLLVGVTYFYLYEFNSPNAAESYYFSNLQQTITKVVSESDKDLSSIEKQYNAVNPKTFNQIKVNTNYPYFLFKNGKLWYWSDYRYVPEYEKIKDIQDLQVIKYNQEYGIFNKKNFTFKNDTICVISLINLYKHYKNENDYLQSGYADKIFHPAPKKISAERFAESKAINGKNGKILFYFENPENEKILNSNIPKTTLWILCLAVLFFSIHFLFILNNYRRNHSFGKAFLLLLIFGVGLRFIMLKTGIPLILSNKDYFNPSFFTGDLFAPTFGDTILNALFLFVFLTIVAAFYYRSRLFLDIVKTNKKIQSVVSIFCVLGVMYIAFLLGEKIENIYENSLYKLGFSLSLSFNIFMFFTLIYYLLLLGIFFISSHILIFVFLRIQKNLKHGFLHWLYAFVMGIFIFILIGEPRNCYLIAGIYFLIVYLNRLPRYFYSLRFQTLLYFIIAAFCFTLIAIEVIQYKENQKNLLEKQIFGHRYLADNDLLGEGLLEHFSQTIKNEENIVNAFSRNTLASEAIKQLVKDEFLDIYFDKYEVEVISFDSLGNNLGNEIDSKNLEFYKSKFKNVKYKTEINNLYFINETGNSFIKEYISFNEILKGSSKIGHIVLDLKLKDGNSDSVYPELLLDKKFVQNPESKNYSYGIFENNSKILFNSGSYNYLMNFSKDELKNNEIYRKGISKNGFSHFAIKGQNHRTIVVSQNENYWKNILSNFSFLFLLSILSISILLIAFGGIYGMRKFSMNFSTKIQLYLNAAFLLPLIIIIVLTLSVVRGTLISIQEKSFIDNTKNIAGTFQVHLENYLAGKTSRPFFEMEINQLARNTKVDINFFDSIGKINFSTRPLVYQYKLLSGYLNPLAYNKIIEEKENELITNESLGSLNYKTVYIALKGNSNIKYGVIGIPFFDSKTLLEMQVREVVTIILIIFLAMFLLLLVLSYFASDQLTSPLKIIASRLKKTHLDKVNETIDWKSNDEIGLLTQAYNKMIKMLEESKIALSQSEKQTAWREMAKQVAHEIKNPLTPMKLSIQQLQRTLPMDNPKSKDRIQRALNSLTEQIDNISEIANSFSEFAKMPVPRNEPFDLIPVAQKTTVLYSQNNNIKIDFESEYKEMIVLGDRLLVSRVITNLILNGIQSVDPTRQPEIKVRIYKNPEENFGIIEVSDNGVGIPEDVRKKVFIPNFSTKVGGSGLGLAMAKRGIEHAGGNIWFETEEDKGTTFFVDLPISEKQ